MEIPQKGIRWGAAGLWKYHRRESAGERPGYGNTAGLEMGGALMGLTPRSERGDGSKGGGEEKLPDADGVLPQA